MADELRQPPEGGGPRGGGEPVLNAPAVVIWMLAAMAGVHLLRLVLPPETAFALIEGLAFVPARLTYFFELDGTNRLLAVTSLGTHTLLHGDFLHLAFNSAWLLAFGSFMARYQTTAQFIWLFVLGAAAGALSHLALAPHSVVPVVGASGAISAMMGAAARLMFARHFRFFGTRHVVSEVLPLTDSRVMGFAGVWTGINLIFGLSGGFGLVGPGMQIAWAAHLGGFFFGLFTVRLFLPPREII